MDDDAARSFRPGDHVLVSGLYLVEHARHAPARHASKIASGPFPRCGACGDDVRYRLIAPVAPVAPPRVAAEAAAKDERSTIEAREPVAWRPGRTPRRAAAGAERTAEPSRRDRGQREEREEREGREGRERRLSKKRNCTA